MEEASGGSRELGHRLEVDDHVFQALPKNSYNRSPAGCFLTEHSPWLYLSGSCTHRDSLMGFLLSYFFTTYTAGSRTQPSIPPVPRAVHCVCVPRSPRPPTALSLAGARQMQAMAHDLTLAVHHHSRTPPQPHHHISLFPRAGVSSSVRLMPPILVLPPLDTEKSFLVLDREHAPCSWSPVLMSLYII